MTDKIKFTTGGEFYEMKMDSWPRSNVSPSIELTVERKITDIEAKALARVNEICLEKGVIPYAKLPNIEASEALCRAIEQHEAFKQEVSDIVEAYVNATNVDDWEKLKALIIPAPKPDPLVQALNEVTWTGTKEQGEQMAVDFRTVLDALGFEIREKNDD